MTQFPCTSCGACCSSIEGIAFLEKYNQNGSCNKLKDNECTIYEERPLLCRIDEAYDQIFSAYMTRKDFYRQNAKACNELQEKLNISLEYRVYI
ncbi:YkgJ family cysteine cluster protein [Bacillus lacus]|uniref:YkgJ family cysteine cluster protein n=1 Tax=Metabacillus lacus TaxID=1983721 RepID=A0A7X2J2F0_9BACI|nr:YkgJ family cysteine cluster protein [Metabacillus lacus]MRX73378.1 YkgJ family cysteine cluster protein [Metabacillus lacus]